MVDCIPITTQKLAELKKETEKDEELQILKRTIKNGWPEKNWPSRSKHQTILDSQGGTNSRK